MTPQQIRRFVVAAVTTALTAASLLVGPALTTHGVPSASAAACPDVEVIFARGRMEPAGAGQIGN
ncbi:MAG: cutinase, partial [Mycobacterium sp.]|nr:cutinase [Mycobacterium sp.]